MERFGFFMAPRVSEERRRATEELIVILIQATLRAVIVCSCHAVTDREIARAARAGARTPCQIAEMCGAGSSCGGCRDTVRELLGEAHGEPSAPASIRVRSERESASA
jgi:bacterioferritin-associated ferredoxin